MRLPGDLAPMIGRDTLDESVQQGESVRAQLADPDTPTTVVGVSQGAVVAQQYAKALAATRPDARTQFVTYGDPDRPNPVSWANPVMGAFYFHPTYDHVETTDGNVTHVLVKVEELAVARALSHCGDVVVMATPGGGATFGLVPPAAPHVVTPELRPGP